MKFFEEPPTKRRPVALTRSRARGENPFALSRGGRDSPTRPRRALFFPALLLRSAPANSTPNLFLIPTSNRQFPPPPSSNADSPQRHGEFLPGGNPLARRVEHAAQRQATPDARPGSPVSRRFSAHLTSPIPARRRRNCKICCSALTPMQICLAVASLPSVPPSQCTSTARSRRSSRPSCSRRRPSPRGSGCTATLSRLRSPSGIPEASNSISNFGRPLCLFFLVFGGV